ncbi:MAG: molybdopterin-dependent oxidoreductase [Mycobacteriales bacterium]
MTAPARLPAPVRVAAGVLAATAALVVLEIGGRLVPGARPAVAAVGDLVIDLTPPWLRDAGIRAFGTADKAVLLAAVALAVAALAAVTGLLAARRPRLGDAAVAALGALAVAAQLGAAGGGAAGSGAAGPLLTSGLAALVGALLLRWLLRRPAHRRRRIVPAATRSPRATAGPAWDRRGFLLRATVVATGVALGGGVVRVLDASAAGRRLRALVRLPEPTVAAPGRAVAAELGIPGLSPVLTPTGEFYRIDTALRVPQVDVSTWALTVGGDVARPLRLTYEDLLAMPQVEADITLQCVSNEVGGDLVGTARWQGVLLADVLRAAGAGDGADQVVGRSVDGFTAGFPLSVALDGRTALIAVGMNGEPLPAAHGYPARLVVPGLYGYVSATKWLASIELTTLTGFDGYWVPRGWSKLGPIKIASRIDVPAPEAAVPAGDAVAAGVAWAPTRGIRSVEVRIDDGAWQPAQLAPALSQDTWVQWRLSWRAEPGEHVLTVRATDDDGQVQTDVVATPRPDGATGLHAVRVLAAARTGGTATERRRG